MDRSNHQGERIRRGLSRAGLGGECVFLLFLSLRMSLNVCLCAWEYLFVCLYMCVSVYTCEWVRMCVSECVYTVFPLSAMLTVPLRWQYIRHTLPVPVVCTWGWTDREVSITHHPSDPLLVSFWRACRRSGGFYPNQATEDPPQTHHFSDIYTIVAVHRPS